MKQQLRQISSNPLVRNFASVGFIQGLSMLLPLLTIPYLLSTLGADGFALISLALAVVTYFVVLTDYGFNLMGTRLVALHRDNPDRLNTIFSNMLYAQVLLTLVAIVMFSAIVWAVPAYHEHFGFFQATFGVVIGSTLLPTWFFQGREKFNQLHLIMLVYRAVYTLGIFILVTDDSDLIKVPLLNSATSILGGLAGLIYIMWRYNLRFNSWNWKEVWGFLGEGWNLFVSAISITSMQQLPIIILAFFANATLVGYYAFAEKILLLFRVVVQLLSTVLYPRVIRASQVSVESVKKLVTRVQSYGGILFGVVALILYFTPAFLESYFPQYYTPSLESILEIWAILPLLIFIKTTSQQLLLAFDLTKSYSRVMIGGAVANVLLLLALGSVWQYKGIALAVLLTEVFLIFALQWRSREPAPKTS